MEVKKGVPASPGVAIGKAMVMVDSLYSTQNRRISSTQTEAEIARFLTAVHSSLEELEVLEDNTRHLGQDLCIVFQGHALILADPVLQTSIIQKIQSDFLNAESAVSEILNAFQEQMQGMVDEYQKDRGEDFVDIKKRLLRHLSGNSVNDVLQHLKAQVILVSKDLTPSETATLPLNTITAFVTDMGGKTSHAAIVARSRGIPAVVGLGSATIQIRNEDTIIVDGQEGYVIINPNLQTLEKYKNLKTQQEKRKKKLETIRDLPVETQDGHKISLLANIEKPEDIPLAIQNGAEGIGLYRTEFLYLHNLHPNEETHYSAYVAALHHLGGKKIIIRTLDLGADKDFGLQDFREEKNPFLGCRSIRLCFEKQDIFKTQLRAILKASKKGNLEIMFPMISSLEEVVLAKKILEDTKQNLRAEGIEFDEDMKVGIMVEIPAAAVMSDILAKEVDFFSIGTNDLIQYTLAVDRINPRVASFYKPAHPAIFRLIHQTIISAHNAKIQVGMCGEMSSEKYIIPLMGLGLREFSVSASFLPEVKYLIRNTTMRHATQIAQYILKLSTQEETIEYLNKALEKKSATSL